MIDYLLDAMNNRSESVHSLQVLIEFTKRVSTYSWFTVNLIYLADQIELHCRRELEGQ